MPKLSAQAYRRIGASDHTIEWILNGVQILFKEEPATFECPNRVLTAKHVCFIDEEIQWLLDEGAIYEVR